MTCHVPLLQMLLLVIWKLPILTHGNQNKFLPKVVVFFINTHRLGELNSRVKI